MCTSELDIVLKSKVHKNNLRLLIDWSSRQYVVSNYQTVDIYLFITTICGDESLSA